MGFWSLFVVASMPILELLLIGVVGAYLASGYSRILTPKARRDINKIVFVAFQPALIFGSLAKTITLEEVISWWFMLVNIAIIFVIGGVLGWIAVKLLKPESYLEGPIIASCSAGNLGFLLLLVIPAVCSQKGSPFGDKDICTSRGMSYNSLSMALGGMFIWTHTYSLMKQAGLRKEKLGIVDEDIEENVETPLLKPQQSEHFIDQETLVTAERVLKAATQINTYNSIWHQIKEVIQLIVDELMAPPTLAAVLGFVFGVIPWIKSAIYGVNAPLRVIADSIKLLGDGTLPCVILVLGGNLIQGLRKSSIKWSAIIAIIVVRYLLLPVCGIIVVKTAIKLGFLPQDILYQYVLLLQFALPPATAIGTMAQLFDVGQEECSVIFLWTYLVAGLALTLWSTVFMFMLS